MNNEDMTADEIYEMFLKISEEYTQKESDEDDELMKEVVINSIKINEDSIQVYNSNT